MKEMNEMKESDPNWVGAESFLLRLWPLKIPIDQPPPVAEPARLPVPAGGESK